MIGDYTTFIAECIKDTWLFDEDTCLLKDAFHEGDIVMGSSFEQKCIIATNTNGDHYIMSPKTIMDESPFDWFTNHFKIISNYIA